MRLSCARVHTENKWDQIIPSMVELLRRAFGTMPSKCDDGKKRQGSGYVLLRSQKLKGEPELATSFTWFYQASTGFAEGLARKRIEFEAPAHSSHKDTMDICLCRTCGRGTEADGHQSKTGPS